MERLELGDVEGLRVGRFGSQINTTCIVYRIGDTVIDTGPPNQWRQVRAFLAERRVERVVVTHHHEDHGGNLAAIGASMDSRLLAPPGGVERLADGFRLRPYQRIIWGRPDRVRAEPLPAELPIGAAGALVPIPAPGHSVDMTCFHARERGWLFTGDLYISSRPRFLRRDESVRDTLGTLRRILELDFDTMFCSHRGPIADGKASLRRKLGFLEELCGRAQSLHGEGRSVAEITRTLLGREGGLTWITLGHFSKRNLIRSCLRAGRAASC